VGTLRRTGIAAFVGLAALGLAYRFALAYRVRAGYPRRNPPTITPADVGLTYESMLIHSDGASLPAWFIPARDGAVGPGVVLIHGWESARDRTLPMAIFLHAAGFHCLTFDVRAHGTNPPDLLPVTGGEFGADALAAFQALVEQP
jgi:pimeloyl-ACP methyl ester carboxylesterase